MTNLDEKAKEIRRSIIKMLAEAGSGHTAGAMGMADVFTALYFGEVLEKNDKVILSNGHICPVWYATLAEAGYFPKEELMTLRKINSRLQGHPQYQWLPGVENTGGPLAQGLSQAVGRAIAGEKVYCLMSDAEFQEGQTWEAIMLAGNKDLPNLKIIIDRNNIQISGSTDKVMNLEPFVQKLQSFSWKVVEIDGHNFEQIIAALKTPGKLIIVAKTIPGKGVSFMEGKYEWHGKVPNKEEVERALAEL